MSADSHLRAVDETYLAELARREIQPILEQQAELNVARFDVRDVKLTGGQIIVMREMRDELERQGFHLYPAFIDGLIRRWQESPSA